MVQKHFISVLILMFLTMPLLPIAAQENTPEALTPGIYTITSQDRVNARACPQITCTVLQKLAPGARLTVIEIVQGDTVSGSDQWLHVSQDGVDAYVHSSLAAPTEPSDESGIGGGAGGTTASDSGDAEAYYNRGNSHFSQGNYVAAAAYFDEGIRRNPDHLEAYFYQAVAYYMQGDYDAAIAAFSEVIRINPDHANAHYNRGCLYALQGEDELWTADFDEYIHILEENGLEGTMYFPCTSLMERISGGNDDLLACTDATGIPQNTCEVLDALHAETNAATYLNAGNYDAAFEQYEDAIAAYDEAIRLDPDLTYAYFGRGNAHNKLGNSAQAIADFTEVIRLNPDFANAYYNRGNAYLNQNDFQQAIADYDQNIRLKPDHANTYFNRGLAYIQLGNYGRAVTNFDEYIQRVTDDPKAYLYRGFAYTAQGNYSLAMPDFDEAIRLDPETVQAYYWRGMIYYEQGKNDLALADLKEYVRLAGANAEPAVNDLIEQLESSAENPIGAGETDRYLRQALAYAAQDNYQQALTALNQAIQLDPNNAAAFIMRGNAHYHLGNYAESVVDLNRAIELDPSNPIAYIYRGNSYDDLGNFEQAIANYNQAITLDPENAEAYRERCLAYFNDEAYEQAFTDCVQAITLNPEDGYAYYHRGNIYIQQGEYEQAIPDLNEAIRLLPDYPWGYFKRGLAYGRLGDNAQAIADYSETIRLEPTATAAYFNRGNAYADQGENELALADLHEYVRLAGEDADSRALDRIEQLEAELGTSEQATTSATDTNTFSEDFSNNSRGWEIDQDTSVQNGALQIRVIDNCCYYYATVPYEATDNFTFTVDAMSLSDAAYAVIFRSSSDSKSGYFFEVNPPDGYFALRLVINNELHSELIPWQSSVEINHFTPNQLGVVANGDQITLYINGTEVGSVTNNQLTGGYFALGVTNYASSDPLVEAEFDNLVITPQKPLTQSPVDCTDTATTGVPQAECEALVAFYASTNGSGWEDSTNWNLAVAIDTWHGITVNGGHVTGIDLHENQLRGSIPDLSALSQLFSLNLSDNQLRGSIPDVSNLPRLYSLHLSNNQLSGRIPDLAGLTQLYRLDLANNQLVSEIPPSIMETSLTTRLILCGGDNNITSSDPEIIAWVQLHDQGWTQGCD